MTKTLDLYTVIYNDEDFLPYFLEYYSFVDRMTFIDSNSTDRTIQILKDFATADHPNVRLIQSGATWWDWNLLHPYRNHIWKDSEMDIILFPDCDEIFYHPSGLRWYLENTDYDVYEMQGFEMVAPRLPDGSILKVNKGVPFQVYNKFTIFKNGIDIKFPSAHTYCSPSPSVCKGEIKLLHYRNLGIELMKKRRDREKARLSKNFKYRAAHTDKEIKERFEKLTKEAVKVI